MSKKDYIKIAQLFRKLFEEFPKHDSQTALAVAVNGLADIFEEDNPRFDRARFRTACLRGDK